MAGIIQNRQKRLVFFVVFQLKIADYTGLLKKDSEIILRIVKITMIIQQKS